jgi:hypothetical protein
MVLAQASSVAWVSLLMSTLLAMLALTVVFSTLYIFRSWSLWVTGVSGEGLGWGRPAWDPCERNGLPAMTCQSQFNGI